MTKGERERQREREREREGEIEEGIKGERKELRNKTQNASGCRVDKSGRDRKTERWREKAD